MKFLASFFALICVTLAQDTRDLKRSGAEQIQFSDTQIKPLLGMIMDRKLPFPEINDRVAKQEELIDRHFGGKKTHIRLRGFYSPLSPLIPMASGISASGDPEIIVYLPAVMDAFSHSSFRCTFVRQIMHERDHLTEMTKNVVGVNLENETHIHALTAEFVLVPLIGKYKQTCAPNDINHYNAWIKSGRNEKSPIWKDHMKRLYAPALGFR